MPKPCDDCGGTVEDTVISGVVSLKRKRSMWASGKTCALRSETCVECGYTRLYADRPDRLFPDLRRSDR